MDMYLYYATVVGDFELVVEYWIMEEEWTKALDVINRQVRSHVLNLFTLYLSHLVESRALLSIRTSPHNTGPKRNGRFLAATTWTGSYSVSPCPSPSATYISRPAFAQPSHPLSFAYHFRAAQHIVDNSQPPDHVLRLTAHGFRPNHCSYPTA